MQRLLRHLYQYKRYLYHYSTISNGGQPRGYTQMESLTQALNEDKEEFLKDSVKELHRGCSLNKMPNHYGHVLEA